MLRLLSYNHIFTYIVLFLVTVAARLPSFHANYFEQDEAFYLTCAEKLIDGGVQYLDTMDNKPPILVWFYAFFVWIFRDGAIFAIRAFTVMYLFVAALLLNQFVVNQRIIERFSLLPGFLLVFFCSVPWYAQEMNGELLMLIPIMLAMFQILKLQERSSKNNGLLLIAGMMMGLCFMIKYQAIFLLLGLMGAYLTIQSPRLSEVFSMISGFGLVIVSILGVVYLTGAMSAYLDIGLLYNLDYIFLGKNLGEELSPLFNLGQYFKLWGPFLAVAIIAMIQLRVSYFSNAIRLRKVEAFLLFWAGSALLSLAIGGGRLYLHYFYILVPPLAIYAARFFESRLNPWLRQLSFLLLLLVPLYTYGVFAVSAYPKTFSMIDPYLRPNGWISGLRVRLNEPHPLEKYIDKSLVHNGILVMDYEPEIYARLNLPCATRYTNFSLAYFRLMAFRERSQVELYSKSEPLAETYRAFRDEMPEYIIDPHDLFPLLRSQMPILFADFEARQVTMGDRNFKLYFR